jgi:predicted PurR-regulated permease PerM
MKRSEFKKRAFIVVAIILAIAAFTGFLLQTGYTQSPLALFLMTLFLLVPFRKTSIVARRILFVVVVFFVFWLISFVPETLAAFLIAFTIAYLFDPVVSRIVSGGRSRWIVSLLAMLFLFGAVSLVAVYVFPAIFSQINNVLSNVRSIVSTASEYFEKEKLQQLFSTLGIEDKKLQEMMQNEFLPELKSMLQNIISMLLQLFRGVSGIATQLFNAVLIPVFSFYFLKDFDKIKEQLKIILGKKDEKLLKDLRRINDIFRVYVSWQVFAATMIAIITSIVFTIAGVENGILLGILCGFLNPIPYIGLIASWILSSLIILITAPDDMLYQIIVIIATVNIIHFVNAYFVEPNILGNRIGLHPLILIASLFIFGALFGFLGLLVAVPSTATLMLFYEDWKQKLQEES